MLYSRKSIRLKEYDYSLEGCYFLTICTQERTQNLSEIKTIEDKVGYVKTELTYIGEIIEKALLLLEKKYVNIRIKDYVIMPNHIHIIIEITKRADTRPAPTIPDIVCEFKSRITMRIIEEVRKGRIKCFNKKFWQRNYYEHIIRTEKEYIKIKQYILENPLKWKEDELYKM